MSPTSTARSISNGRLVIEFDHHATETSHDRAEVLARVRETPVFFTEAHGGYWVVTSHELAKHVLRTPETYSSLKHPDGTGGVTIPTAVGPVLIPAEADDPYHRALRKTLTPKFSRSAVEKLRPHVEAVVTKTIDRVVELGDFDVVHDIADVVPAGVMVDYLGFPEAERVPFIKSVQAALAVMPEAGAGGNGEPSEEMKAGLEAFTNAVNTIRAFVAQRREAPTDDVVSYLVAPEQSLTEDELLWLIFTLFVGGAENPAAFISNAMQILSEDHKLRERLIAEPELIEPTIEELFRVVTPGVSLARNVIQDAELGGQKLVAGDRVLVWLPAANHDEAVFADPEKIEPGRSPCPHVAFGDGPHFCLGASLARLQFQLLFREILSRIPNFHVHVERAERFADAATMYGWRTMPASTNA
jgi:cytochrome P450